jgi:hypothetical protein
VNARIRLRDDAKERGAPRFRVEVEREGEPE